MSKAKCYKLSVVFLIIILIIIFFFAINQKKEIDFGEGEEDLVIIDGKIYLPGEYDYKSLIIEGGVVIVEVSDNNQAELILRAQEKIVIKEGAGIDLSGRGYEGLNSEIKEENLTGLSFDYAGGGGSHGGAGGFGSCIERNSPKSYGFNNIDKSLGAGGGIGTKVSDGRGGNGGGFIKLIAPEIIIEGELLVNGEDGVERGGGGAGGKIVLLANNIILNGSIFAKGGIGGTALFQGAGGGGGGIVIFNVPFAGKGLIEVGGGEGGKALDYYSGCPGGNGEDGKIVQP